MRHSKWRRRSVLPRCKSGFPQQPERYRGRRIKRRRQPLDYSTVGSALWVSAPGGEYGSDGVDGSPAIMTTDVQGCSKGYVGGGGDGANEFDSKPILILKIRNVTI